MQWSISQCNRYQQKAKSGDKVKRSMQDRKIKLDLGLSATTDEKKKKRNEK